MITLYTSSIELLLCKAKNVGHGDTVPTKSLL